ncbi:hypothetical protein [Pseudaestuariivita atlantica]|uniref:DUF2059 domain-containing protein n=1 Tax=Pseudaestuariivita atlantica TaxID=1317121 RepID=A0A0L1JJV3_9RHOB|nr:hypothetical protein [Pseudaestuariivita atlantica]KNG91992.1 hypothetical protein ATO11_19825 [Pseudaestuariivita atlantica]
MNRFMTLTTAALVATLGTGAFATTNLERQVERYVGDVDFSVLSDTEKAEVRNIIYGSGTFSERRAILMSILDGTGAMVPDMPVTYTIENNWEGLEAAVQRFMPEFRVDNYDDPTLLAIQNILYSAETEQEKLLKIEGLLRS